MIPEHIDFKTQPFCRELIVANAWISQIFTIACFYIGFTIGAVVLLLFGVMVITSQRRVTINLKQKTYREYVRFLGFRFGDIAYFESLEYIFIKENKITETLQHSTYTDRLERTVIDAYLKLSNGEKIRLFRRRGKKSLMKNLRPVVRFLEIQVFDDTEGERKEIIFRRKEQRPEDD